VDETISFDDCTCLVGPNGAGKSTVLSALNVFFQDRAYISAALHLSGDWDEMRRAGLHILPTDRKSNILQLLAVAQELSIPCFVVFDADGDETNAERRRQHEADNKALLTAIQIPADPFPAAILWGANYAVWPTNVEDEVKQCFSGADWDRIGSSARNKIDPGASGLKKNPAFIGELLSMAWEEGKEPKVMMDLVDRMKAFAKSVELQ
jgi:putative ATP-dependent endonuclease of OLD family